MAETVERVVLWGFMASGKTAVGRALARRLGWRHVDLDAEIVRREGRAIAEIFRTDGEAAFRGMEEAVTRELIAGRRLVLSPGGGWITNPAVRALVPSGTLTVWLRVSPEQVLARARADASGIERPLLATPDPAATIRRLLEAREPLYRQADLRIETDGVAVERIVDLVEARVRARLDGSD